MSGFTPGPWTAEPGHAVVYIHSATSRCIAATHAVAYWRGFNDEDLANARLIAAAPDLLSIAKRWLALDAGNWHPERALRDQRDLEADTRAAIAKATSSPSPDHHAEIDADEGEAGR